MYTPAHFRENDPAAIAAIADAYPLAALVASGANGFVVNHLPLMQVANADGTTTLRGHVARGNELWRTVPAATPVVAIFRGEEHYVSPSWYPTKAETGEVVPTWNYTVVHAHGRIRFIEDRAWLRALVGALTERHERGRAAPWSIDDAPTAYFERMLGAIVGFEIDVERWDGKRKASQNRTERERSGALVGLAGDGVPESARAELVRGR
jgi:transcriptional regulator